MYGSSLVVNARVKYEADHVSLHSQTSGSDVNLNVKTFIGKSQLINYWYIFDQYKTIDILIATSKCLCFS